MRNIHASRILLISLGRLNGLVLELLARTPGVAEIVVATRDVERAGPTIRLARVGAGAQGFYPAIRAIAFDFNQPEASAEILVALRPDVTFAAPSLGSWWILDRIPPAAAARLRPAGFGAWLPFQLAPMIRLMTAWKLSGLRSPILSAPYPDVVNPILATRGLAPTCGAGNVDELVPKLKWLVADSLSVAPAEVRVWLVAHHALQRYVYGPPAKDAPPPFLLRLEVAGRALGPEFDADSRLLQPYPLPAGVDLDFLSAGSAVRLITAFLRAPGEPTFMHAPAPGGLPGGYPVVIQDGSVQLDLPAGWTEAEAVAVNRASHRWDGIEAIEPDGGVVFTDRTAGLLRETLSFDRPRLAFEEVEAAAGELRRRFDEVVRRFHAG